MGLRGQFSKSYVWTRIIDVIQIGSQNCRLSPLVLVTTVTPVIVPRAYFECNELFSQSLNCLYASQTLNSMSCIHLLTLLTTTSASPIVPVPQSLSCKLHMPHSCTVNSLLSVLSAFSELLSNQWALPALLGLYNEPPAPVLCTGIVVLLHTSFFASIFKLQHLWALPYVLKLLFLSLLTVSLHLLLQLPVLIFPSPLLTTAPSWLQQ